MFNPATLFARSSRRRWLYPVLSILVSLGLIVGSPLMARAFSIWDVLIQGVQYIQLANMSDEQEVQIGGQINQQLVGSEVRIHPNQDLGRYINEIGQKLAAKSDRPNIPYTFQVIDDKSINAFATMGGFVYINSGLISAADNEAQLASVIAHEIGHIAGRHSLEQMKQTAMANGLVSLAGLDTNTIVQLGMEVGFRLPHSREDEFNADERGLATIGRAGYAQSAMPAFMQKLVGSSGVPDFLSTHPATEDRIASMKKAIDPAKANTGTGLDSKAYKAKVKTLLGS